MDPITSTKNHQSQVVCIMLVAINAILARTKGRIVRIEMEDGSGYNWNITTGDYESERYFETTFFIGVNRATMTAREPTVTNVRHFDYDIQAKSELDAEG